MNQSEMKSIEKDKIQKAIQSVDIEKIYFNGFSCSIGSGDVIITLYRNGEAIKVINTSYTVAKTFSLKLQQVIEIIEKETDNEIMTTDFIQSKLNKGRTK